MMTTDGMKTRWGIMGSHLKSGMCAGIIQVRAVSLARKANQERNAYRHVGNEPACVEREPAEPRRATGLVGFLLQQQVQSSQQGFTIETPSLLPARPLWIKLLALDRSEARAGVPRLQVSACG